MFESALEAGFVSAGVDVMLVGPLPTPGIAYLTRALEADVGVVISASHNAYYDNGIKFFDRTGSKLSDAVEIEIERLLAEPAITRESQRLGRAQRVDKLRVRYQEFCKESVDGVSLDGLRIVLDCSNGAGYKVAPRILNELGAEIIPIGCSPNGRNINDGCGSTCPELLQKTVPAVDADLGIALDGDGDRLIMVDHEGQRIDGDQLIYIIARAQALAGKLRGPVVGTVMSNLGLERALGERGIGFVRAKVGDRYVVEKMRQHDSTLGGESSGHLICRDKTTTGDGIISALQILAIMRESGRALRDLAEDMPMYPQCMINVRVEQRFDPAESAPLRDAVGAAEAQLAERGRIVLRASGTEPVIRVMVEGEDESEVRATAESLAEAVRGVAA